MDSQDYEQHPLSESLVGDAAKFLLESLPVQIAFHNGAPLYLELPVTVEFEVTHTEPGLQGDWSSAGTKPATVETGAEIQVPLFINTGDKLKVDSRDGSYLGRVNADSRGERNDGQEPSARPEPERSSDQAGSVVPTVAAIRPASGPSTCFSRPRRAGSHPPR